VFFVIDNEDGGRGHSEREVGPKCRV
jgi:hypothetical protein